MTTKNYSTRKPKARKPLDLGRKAATKAVQKSARKAPKQVRKISRSFARNLYLAFFKSEKSVVKASKKYGFKTLPGGAPLKPRKPKAPPGPRKPKEPTPVQGPYEVLDLGIPYKNLKNWMSRVKQSKSLNDLKTEDEFFAFKLGDNGSYEVFDTIQEMIDYMRHYDSIAKPRKEQDEFYQALTIVRFNEMPEDWHPSAELAKQRKQENRRRHMRHLRAIGKSIGSPEQDKRYRKNLTPEKRAEYKEKARLRARKSREVKL